ncbi:hypothetical protein D3C72_2072900 [compost metagenome]
MAACTISSRLIRRWRTSSRSAGLSFSWPLLLPMTCFTAWSRVLLSMALPLTVATGAARLGVLPTAASSRAAIVGDFFMEWISEIVRSKGFEC